MGILITTLFCIVITQSSGVLFATLAVPSGGGLPAGLVKAKIGLSGTGIRNDADLQPSINRAIAVALPYVGIAAVIAFVVAGMYLILGFGSDESAAKAKKIAFWSVVGLAVIVLSTVIVRTIIGLI